MTISIPANLRRPFFARRDEIYSLTSSWFEQSGRSGIFDRIESVLLLADRLLEATRFLNHDDLRLNFTRAWSQESPEQVASALLVGCIEGWYRLIHRLVDRRPTNPGGSLRSSRENSVFDLFEFVRSLELMTDEDLAAFREGKLLQVEDLIHALNHRARELHNATALQTRRIRIREVSLQAAYVALIAPINHYRDVLRDELRSLIPGAMPEGREREVLGHLRIARQRLLQNFLGRSRELRELSERITDLQGRGGTIVVSAQAETGKSSVLASLSEDLGRRFADSSQELLGDRAQTVKRLCPWLPHCLYHTTNEGSDPLDFLPALCAQANALLLEPHAILGTSIRITSDDGDVSEIENWLPLDSNLTASRDDRVRVLSDIFRDLLLELTAERGELILVIDGVEDILANDRNLSFLPEEAPRGLVMVLSTTPRHALRLREHFRARIFELEGLRREDLRAFSPSLDQAGLTQLHEASEGAPLTARALAKFIAATSDHKAADGPVDGQLAELLHERQIQAWEDRPDDLGRDPLFQTLLLLATLRPVGPVKRVWIQAYLESLGLEVCYRLVQRLLQRVQDQLEPVGGDLRLASRTFSRVVLREVVGRRDLRRLLSRVSSWLAKDREVDPSYVARFIAAWVAATRGRDPGLRKAARSLMRGLQRPRRIQRCFEVFAAGRRLGLQREIHDLGLYAARRGHERAALTLSLEAGIDPQRSLDELRERGSNEAFDETLRGELLLCLPSPSAEELLEADALLRNAAERGFVPAMRSLGEILLGQGREEGQEWLRRAASSGSVIATYELGRRQIAGEGFPINRIEAIRELERAAEAGVPGAQCLLGETLFDPQASRAIRAQNALEIVAAPATIKQDEGAPGESEPTSQLALSSIEVKHTAPEPDPARARSLLESSADAGFMPAMIILGLRLRVGQGVQRDEDAGSRWLEFAARLGDPLAQGLLGTVIFERVLSRGGPKDELGRAALLLRGCMEACDDPLAMISVDFLARSSPTFVRLFNTSADLAFHHVCHELKTQVSIQLAFLIRRDLALECLDLDTAELLATGVERGNAFACINMALYNARQGWWNEAAALIERAAADSHLHSNLRHWTTMALKDDPEGQLVLGWFVALGKIKDPEDLTPQDRFARARSRGWSLPPNFPSDYHLEL